MVIQESFNQSSQHMERYSWPLLQFLQNFRWTWHLQFFCHYSDSQSALTNSFVVSEDSGFQFSWWNKRIHDNEFASLGKIDLFTPDGIELNIEAALLTAHYWYRLIHSSWSCSGLSLSFNHPFYELLLGSFFSTICLKCCQGWADTKCWRTWQTSSGWDVAWNHYF